MLEPLSDELPVGNYINLLVAEKQQWVEGITDFGLQQQGFQALVELNEFLAAGKKPCGLLALHVRWARGHLS